MAGDSGYSIYTRYINPEFFISMIASDIKELIHTYGHKNCGLRQEELCNKIKEIIPEKKNIIFRYMDSPGKRKWNNDWDRERSKYFNKFYEEEGFINMCFPKKYKNNPILNQLMSKHIDFCKEKDDRLSALQKKFEYSACKQYNRWIDTQRTTFTREYLENVNKFNVQTVNKYFITKDHPGGHDPRGTYQNSKLNCTQYNTLPRSNPNIPVAEAPTYKLQPPIAPPIMPGSQGKDGISVSDKGRGSAKTKSEGKKTPRPKSHTPDSQIPASSKTQADGTHTGQATHVIPKAPVSSVSNNREKQETTHIQGQPLANSPSTAQEVAPPPPSKDADIAPIIQTVPEPTTATSLFPTQATDKDTSLSQTPTTSSSLTINPASSLYSGSSEHSDPLPPADVTKDQDTSPRSTTTPVTSPNTSSTETLPAPSVAVSSLAESKPPDESTPPSVTAPQPPGIPASSSTSTVTTTVATTTAASDALTISTISTIQQPISYEKQVTGTSRSQEPLPASVASGPKATGPTTDKDSQQAVIKAPTSLSGRDNAGISVQKQPVPIDNNKQTTLSSTPSPKTDNSIKLPGTQLPNVIIQPSEQKTNKSVVGTEVKLQGTINQTDPVHSISPDQIRNNRDHNHLNTHVNLDKGKIPGVRPGTDLNNNSFTNKGKNDNPNIIPEGIIPLKHIIPTLIVILATVTLLFQLYKYTPFGLLLGRRRKRKKQDLKRIFEIPEKPAYETPNIIVHELEDPNLVGQTVENDVYTKLLKINRCKQEMQKRKKKNKKTLIEVHMEVLEECKNNEWELYKGDFLEICLRGFINKENETYQKFPNSKLTINNIKNEKTIEDIQKQEILWNNWIENHRNILEQWKKEEWFHMLKNKWRNEEQKYKEKNDKLQENILNEQATHSIVSQKDIWKQWISKQATLIDMFNKEDWFKSIVYVQDKEKDLYHINEYNDISVTTETQLKNEKSNLEYCRSKDIIQKLMVQIHMMVLEECIKEDIIKQKELCIDNFIEDIHNQNNYDEKRNITQCDTHDFNALEFEKIHTSRNK
ncbi:STP1 protein [Plasmodium ovale]|uniref:STP1 protein n=1 Tax=Plasmodium ovale TaxID=36330 RepID=A0A1C3KGZ9_PLAOA|nr:STP1 protein [Plasmodium ovale]